MGDDRYVARVRALLAKAESTDILEEQQAFIAKAQELMTRHRIDAAQLVATGEAKDAPIVHKYIPVARPRQPGGKSMMTLMFAVARANGASAVSHERNGISATVFGTESDIRGIEMLFESLCRQLDHAASYAVRHHKPEGVHGKRYRVSYIAGWVAAVCEKLRDTQTKTEQTEAPEGSSTALVLRSKTDQIEQAKSQRYPKLGTFKNSYQPTSTGYYRGHEDGKRAALGGEIANGAAPPALT